MAETKRIPISLFRSSPKGIIEPEDNLNKTTQEFINELAYLIWYAIPSTGLACLSQDIQDRFGIPEDEVLDFILEWAIERKDKLTGS